MKFRFSHLPMICSLLLHTALAGWLFIQSNEPHQFSEKIEFITTTSKTEKASAQRKSVARHSGKILKSFLPVSHYFQQNPSAPPVPTKASWQDPQNYEMNIMTDSEGMSAPQIRFTHSLWKEIDQAIEASPYLAEYGHAGKVFLQFEVAADGQIIESSFHAKAIDRVLKVFAARAVRQAIKIENLAGVIPPGKIQIHAQFSWDPNPNCQTQVGVHQNFMSFCKYCEILRKDFSATEKTAAYLKALTYGPGAFEEIEKYNHEENRRKTQFDPFEQLSRDPDWNLS